MEVRIVVQAGLGYIPGIMKYTIHTYEYMTIEAQYNKVLDAVFSIFLFEKCPQTFWLPCMREFTQKLSFLSRSTKFKIPRCIIQRF